MFYGASHFNSSINFNTSNVTNMSEMFYYASTFNQPLSFNTSNVTTMAVMFFGASAFNSSIHFTDTSKVISMSNMFQYTILFNQPLDFNTSNVISMARMFSGSAFNQPLSFNTSKVRDMNNMFYGASHFNSSIDFTDTSKVIDMGFMFYYASDFNQDLSFNISNVTSMDNMFINTSLSSDNYNNILINWANQPTIQNNVPLGAGNTKYTTSFAKYAHDILTNTYNWSITDGGYVAPIVCFKEGSKILTNKGYKSIETLKSGDLIKTLNNGFQPIYKIGKREIFHPALKDRIKDQLYKFSKENYTEIFEDLVITGCHSILIDEFESEAQKQKVFEMNNGTIYLTDGNYRLPACLEKKATVYEYPGNYTIYHFALENDDYFMNYGIYANGLLVETCSKRYLIEYSGMTIL